MEPIQKGRRCGPVSLVLADPAYGLRAELIPARGALLCSLQKDGREFLYLDPENLVSPERPRCGMPVLFPCCGRSEGETALFDGRSFPMPIHGFAHTSAWTVVQKSGNEVVLRLCDSEATRVFYPFAFLLELAFRLECGALTVAHRCVNTGGQPLPFDLGYHPYFCMSSLENAVFGVPGQEDRFALPAGPETGRVFLHAAQGAWYADAKTGQRVTVEQAGGFETMVFWSVPSKGFACVEPWQGQPNGLNEHSCQLLAPGGTAAGSIRITPALECF